MGQIHLSMDLLQLVVAEEKVQQVQQEMVEVTETKYTNKKENKVDRAGMG
jgi:hypothetical protein